MKKIVVFFLFFTCILFSQSKKEVIVGILADNSTSETNILLEELKTEVKSVLGANVEVSFTKQLDNNFSLNTAKTNYQTLVDSNADVILSFGIINNIMLYNEKVYPKPTIVFGSINNDFMDLTEKINKTEVNNLSYVIAPFSYKDDIETFNSLFEFKKLGIIVEEHVINELPIKDLLDTYFLNKNQEYKLIPIPKEGEDLAYSLDDVDAVYFAGGNYLEENKINALIKSVNTKKLPSFTAFGIKNVERGILATNHTDSNLSSFFRRIALNIESIVDGKNASDLPVFKNYEKKLTINYATATEINFPLRYSLIARVNFIGEKNDDLKDDTSKMSLLKMLEVVLDENLSLKAEKKNLDLADQDVKNSKSNYLPNLSVSVDGIYIDPELAEISAGQNPEFSTSGNAVLQQLIYSENASANIDIQKELQKSQKEIYNSTQLDAVLNTSIAYFNTLILKTNTQIQNQNLQITKQNLDFAEQNFRIGSSGKADVLRFRSQLAQNTQNLIEANNDLEQSFNTINELLGQSMNTKIDIQDLNISDEIFEKYNYDEFFELLDYPNLKQKFVDFLVEETKNNAPELKSINYNLNALKRNYKLYDKGRFIPTVSLQGQYSLAMSQSGAGSSYPVGAPNIPDGTYNVGLNVSLPIFKQNLNNINRQTVKIQEDQLLIEQENTYLNLEKNIHDIVLDLINQIANIEISKVSEENAKQSLELTQNSYKNGAVSVIELIDAQTNYIQAQLSKSTANYNFLITSMQLERAFGYFFLMNNDVDNQAFFQRAKQYILNKN